MIRLNFSECIIIPNEFFAPDAENSMLAEKYNNNLKFKSDDDAIMPWSYDGKQINVYFVPDYFEREKRHWWGYPSQILLVPAFAVDLIGIPIAIVCIPFYFIGVALGIFDFCIP